MGAECGFEPATLRADPLFHELTVRCDDANLALILVNVDANMLHGWPPSIRGVDRVNLVWGRVWATTSRGASRFIPSFRLNLDAGSIPAASTMRLA